MSAEMDWSHDFCLFCDRQTAEGAYCSQACRVADLEKSGYTSEPLTPSGSPSSSSAAWHMPQGGRSTSTARLHLEPSFNFAAYRSNLSSADSPPLSPRSPRLPSCFAASSSSSTLASYTESPKQRLSSSSSRASLSSISSSTSTTTQGLSDAAYTQLRDYSNCFDQLRNWKRRVTWG